MSKKLKKSISVITPILNGAEFLEYCIQSVINQGYDNVEHIFVDGGSVDGTIDILNKYELKYPRRIKIIIANGSTGGEAWNIGLEAACGDVIGWLGSDDIYVKDACAIVSKFFNDKAECFFLYGRCDYIDSNGKLLKKMPLENFSYDNLLNKYNKIPMPSSFFRKEVVDTVGKLDTYGNDLDYIIRIAKQYKFFSKDKVLSNFRVHNTSETGNLKKYIQVCKKDIIVSRNHGGRYWSGYRISFYNALAKYYFPKFLYNSINYFYKVMYYKHIK
jgi:glycosyltransferase involved in cell wall biosynthesis